MSEKLYVCDYWQTCQNPVCAPDRKDTFLDSMFSPAGFRCVPRARTVHAIPYVKEATPMTHELLKPVSIKALEAAGFCKRELHRLCYLFLKEYSGSYSYSYEWALTPVLKCASQCEGGMAFLIKHGFIREKAQKTYKRGDVFRVANDSDCILSYVGDEKMVLVVISDTDKGNYWHHAQPVKDAKKVTEQEMLTLTQNKKFELIK